jgi:hypothetical protein
MPSRSRVILAILMVIVILAGIGLALIDKLDPTVISYDSQKNVCNFQYQIELNPLQTQKNNCAVLQNDWLVLSVHSNSNLSMSISLAKVGGGQVTLFNNTSTNLNASFPITYSGAIVSIIRNNFQTVASANGSLSIYSISFANTTSLSQTHPYRFVGEVLIAAGAFGLFLVAWNPKMPSLVESNLARRNDSVISAIALTLS